MSSQQSEPKLVAQTVKGLLPRVNQRLDWEYIRRKFDPEPEGTALSFHFSDDSGEGYVEELTLAVNSEPRIVMLDEADDSWEYLGAIATFHETGLRCLNPDDELTVERAYYQHGDIDIHPVEGQSRGALWLIGKSIFEIVLEIAKGKQAEEDNGGS